jgi:RNA-directed DNA polymerase
MSDDKRATIRAQVQATSKDEVVLDEMIRRGFWQENTGAPSLPAELIRRQTEIRKELESLAKDAHAYRDPEQALKQIQNERMKAARERRVETKLRLAKLRHDRATAWHQRQGKEITHLGEGVSAALHGVAGIPERLAKLKLPPLADAGAMATAMGIKLGELRFLACDRKVAKVDHYVRFAIPKKTGGMREISAPMPRLKRAQYWIMANILLPLEAHDAAHGFRAKRSILTNARPHVGRRTVINIDLKDFFPTIGYGRVKGFFVNLGYPEKVAAPMALICTDAERDMVEIDGRVWNVARGLRRLPQGAPTSPAIANIIANRLDRRMIGAARKHGFTYTRYADDMTFSGDAEPSSTAVSRLLWQLRKIAEAEGFTFNDKKTRVMGAGARQDVTGLVVNAKPAVAREERRRFRAWLHHAEAAMRGGAAVPEWTNGKGVPSDALGFAGYLAMVDAKHGAPMVARTKAVYAGRRAAANEAKPGGTTRADFRAAAAAGKTPPGKAWTHADRAPPTLEAVPGAKPPAAALAATTTSVAGTVTSVPSVAARPTPPNPPASPWGALPPIPPVGRAQPTGDFWTSLPGSILKSIPLMVLFALPVVGPLLGLFGLYHTWRAYAEARKRR